MYNLFRDSDPSLSTQRQRPTRPVDTRARAQSLCKHCPLITMETQISIESNIAVDTESSACVWYISVGKIWQKSLCSYCTNAIHTDTNVQNSDWWTTSAAAQTSVDTKVCMAQCALTNSADISSQHNMYVLQKLSSRTNIVRVRLGRFLCYRCR